MAYADLLRSAGANANICASLVENVFSSAYASPWTSWTPTITGFSANPSGGVYKYMRVGNWIVIVVSQTGNGTSNATSFTISLPVQARNSSGLTWIAPTLAFDNTTNRTCGLASIDANATVVYLYTDYAGTGWTASGGKRVYFQMFYEAA